MNGRMTLAAMVAAGALALPASAMATPFQTSLPYTAVATANINATATGCDNSGSEITIDGTLTLGGLGVDVLFENQDNNTGPGHHTATGSSTASVTVSDLTPSSIPKQPVRGGVGGNPWIYIRFDTGSGPTGWILIGRCVQGAKLKAVQQSLSVPATASALLDTLSCDNHSSSIELGAGQDTGEIDADVVFTNNRKFTHYTTGDAMVGIVLDPPVTVRKSVAFGGAGGNPLISLRFKDDMSNPLGDWYHLGRCVQLNK